MRIAQPTPKNSLRTPKKPKLLLGWRWGGEGDALIGKIHDWLVDPKFWRGGRGWLRSIQIHLRLKIDQRVFPRKDFPLSFFITSLHASDIGIGDGDGDGVGEVVDDMDDEDEDVLDEAEITIFGN